MSDNVNNINYKAIRCTEIPELFLDKLVAKKHFCKFGKITRFILYPQRLSCTLEYDTEDAAERALMEGGDYNGHVFTIEYAAREVGHVHTTEEWVDPDVQAELEAMGSMPTTQHMRSVISAAMKPPVSRPPRSVLKPAKTEALIPAAPPPVARIDAAVRSELEAILRRPAQTEEDKFRVLDARDKLIRLKTVRQTDIKKAVSTRGTCPDMCPEKERLMREFQRQVSSFEAESSFDGTATTISHRRAIKEYSRSSADQEVPLPHELRSESVLQMTMLYLMHRIMDLCDEPQTSLSDWFHFVWDRTRSIRKDITQQELCSVGVVELVEQCARFHIHCAARLVAEEPSVFDKKINAENLTKCLQTLKYMYHDLRIRHEVCPNEAEFRSYIILLNLGDANFLWEVKQLPAAIQNSAAIRRAIAFFNALQNNNYVRFFDMVRAPETSYMSACILLSYFSKLRHRAMEVIYKAHNWRKASTVLPLAHLVQLLGFEDDLMAADFFQYHGWHCDGERVLLDSVKRPDVEYSMERAMLFVESKRTVSVGECVYGRKLDSPRIFESHEPHNSFDANGYLRTESWAARDQLRGDKAQTSEGTLPTNTQPPPQPATNALAHGANASNNIFKIPQVSQPSSATKQQQGKVFGTSLFDGIRTAPKDTNAPAVFKPPPSGGFFGSALFKPPNGVSEPARPPAPKAASPFSNIFSAAAQETRNIFQASQHEQAQFVRPQPVHASSIFPSPANATFLPPPSFSASPFALSSNAQQYELEEARKRQKQAELAAQLAQAEQRKRELEEEQRRKEQQLLAERQRLKLLEQQRELERQAAARRQQQLEEEEAAARRQQQLQQLQLHAQQQTDALLADILHAEVEAIAAEELAVQQAFERQCQALHEQILHDDVLAEVEQIVQEEYELMCRDQWIQYKYVHLWREYMRQRAEQRQLIDVLPRWATGDSRAHQTAQLQHPRERDNMQMIKRYRHGQPCDFRALLWADAAEEAVEPLDIAHIVACRGGASARPCATTVQSLQHFKLMLTLPEEAEELAGFESLCNKWLRKYLKLPPKPPSASAAAFISTLTAHVALCVRKVSGSLSLRNELGQRVQNECDHASAIVLLMTCSNLAKTRQRLHRLVKLCCMQRALPVGFVVYDGEAFDAQQLAHALQLDQLLADDKIGAYKFCGCGVPKNQFRCDVQLERALRFVVRHGNEPSDMRMQALTGWLDAGLGEEMWRRWQLSSVENPVFAQLCLAPQNVVALYNEAVDRMSEIALQNWQAEADFPSELRELLPAPRLHGDLPRSLECFPPDWKDSARQVRLGRLLARLKLPACDDAPAPTDVEGWELWLLNYAALCLPTDEQAATEAAYEAIKVLIELLNSAAITTEDCLPPLSFLTIIKKLVVVLVNYVLQHTAPATEAPAEVFYRLADFTAYCEQPWWLNTKLIENITVNYEPCNTPHEETTDSAEQALHSSCMEIQQAIQHAEQVVQDMEQRINVLQQQTNNSLQEQKRVSVLQRDLDESLYQFEVNKRCGVYDTAVAVDEFAEEQENKSPQRTREKQVGMKRKHADNDEAEAVMAKAYDLIQKLETRQDQSRRMRFDEFAL